MGSTNKMSVPQSTPYMASSTGKNNQPFNKQLENTEIDTSFNGHTKHNINNHTPHETQSN